MKIIVIIATIALLSACHVSTVHEDPAGQGGSQLPDGGHGGTETGQGGSLGGGGASEGGSGGSVGGAGGAGGAPLPDALCEHVCASAASCALDMDPACVDNCEIAIADCTLDERVTIRGCAWDFWNVENDACDPPAGYACLDAVPCLTGEVSP